MGDRQDEDARKLFIGGLSAETTKEDLQDYFGQYGEVQMATIKTDVYTSRSRGFGFLIFKDKSSVDQVVSQGSKHEVNGKIVEAKLATPQSTGEEKSAKVFVGGLDKNATKDDIKDAFEIRGPVVDVFVPTDQATGEGKGFAFVTFSDADLASSLCDEGKITILNKECDIKKAKNKNEGRGGGRGGGFRGGRGGGFQTRGGGRGGYGGGYEQYGGYGGGSGYEQYGGYSNYPGGYGGGGQSYGYEQQYGGGYDQSSGYGAGGYGGDQNGGGYGGQDQYKMKGSRGRGGYNPY